MKHNIIVYLLGASFFLNSCNDLDLNPLSEGSSESWYSTESEIEMSVKDLYRAVFWETDREEWTDDYMYRESLSPITQATLNGEQDFVKNLWTNQYKAIARANTILANMDKAATLGVPQKKLDQFTAEACFARASMYARLVSHFGDVVYVTSVIDMETAFTIGRTSKSEIIKAVYEDFDKAAEGLPVSYTGSNSQRATKGAALALKARFALYNGDWEISAEAAKACMDLGIYKLHSNYGNLFLSTTKNADESIFVIPRKIAEKDNFVDNGTVLNAISRNPGGWAAMDPSWDLLAAYTCIDGKPIDESPLFDSHNPFKNRDPRCTATIVEFGTRHLGYSYQPHPDSLEVMNYNTGKMQKNNDNRVNAQFASFNGLIWKKGVDETWLQNGFTVDPDKIIIRYADVVLMYAEAKIELNQIDNFVLQAINMVRSRAYGVSVSSVGNYPEVTVTEQDALRKILRLERRMEFANEGLRYMDLIRWKLAGKALNTKVFAMLDPNDLIAKVVKPGLWFWPSVPQIDEDGIADFSYMESAGQIKLVAHRLFDENCQYLWPIPSKEILINENIRQNPGY